MPAADITPDTVRRVLVLLPDGRLVGAELLGPVEFRDGPALIYTVRSGETPDTDTQPKEPA